MGDITGAMLVDALFQLFELDSDDGMHDDYAVWRARIRFEHYHPELDSPMDRAGLLETIRRLEDPYTYVDFFDHAWVVHIRGWIPLKSRDSEGRALAITVIQLAKNKHKNMEGK